MDPSLWRIHRRRLFGRIVIGVVASYFQAVIVIQQISLIVMWVFQLFNMWDGIFLSNPYRQVHARLCLRLLYRLRQSLPDFSGTKM